MIGYSIDRGKFKLRADFPPRGDQPKAIKEITEGFLKKGYKKQTLVGVTGSGKTYTMANVIANLNKPTLVITHNKTLSAQLYREFKEFFPENRVEYFVSYYDYYQPEAYVPELDLYIEKDAKTNDEIEALRLRATSSLMERDDVIIVASVSSIYGLGSPEDYKKMLFTIYVGDNIEMDELLIKLINLHYERSDILEPGKFTVKGDVIDIYIPYIKEIVRIEFFDDEIERIAIYDGISYKRLRELQKITIYPATHFVTTEENLKRAIMGIEAELKERVEELKSMGKIMEANRLEMRTKFDIEMLIETGSCKGIENYSRHLSGRKPGERPSCLLDYFPDDYLIIIDESHVTLPQIRGMYEGDRARKLALVEHGFRLPSALDNRPLRFEEFMSLVDKILFVSATPGDYEISVSEQVVEQIVRPTGLLDPKVEVRGIEGQIEDLYYEIKKRVERNERVLVTTLTKKMAEELTNYLQSLGIKARYLHSEINTIERVEIVRDLRLGKFDCLVGINLLREGLDIPEVSLVAILDADKEGFLRSTTSLIQTAGRAARNVNGTVILYADTITKSMKAMIDETNRRRKIQEEYNKKHNITPQTIKKKVVDIIERLHRSQEEENIYNILQKYDISSEKGIRKAIEELTRLMKEAAKQLKFESASIYRDAIFDLEKRIKKQQKQAV
jgi:excinuclease ABC subunit B